MKIRDIMQSNQDLQSKLFVGGYLITTNERIDLTSYPFFGNWKKYQIANYNILIHNEQTFYSFSDEQRVFFLIGHAINPFDSSYQEEEILQKLMDASRQGKEQAIQYLNELTGNFLIGCLSNDKLYFVSDPAGMLFSCYGKILKDFYLTSHPQLVADLCDLEKDEYILKLEKYKYFYKYGLFFPGDLTQFKDLRRVLQNHFMYYDGENILFERFYPVKDLQLVSGEQEYEILIDQVVSILANTISLAMKKWDDIAISMTGGMDSKTTVACAKDFYDKCQFYSYISMHGDKIDAEAAHSIAKHIGIDHKIYNITEDDNAFENIEEIKAILQHNNGGYKVNANDVRKRAFFSKEKLFKVEIKSWVSEIARANYYKKFGLKKMPKHLSARNMTSMYKIFTTQRKLAKETDKVFVDFINKTGFHLMPKGYDESDMYLWEFRYSAWGGMVITLEHTYSSVIFIPFNNRNLLNLMLQAPLRKRITDEFHEDLIKRANHKISETGITITNWNETKKRMYVEKAYFKLHSLFSKF